MARPAAANEFARFYHVLEALPTPVYLQAPDYSIRYANKAFRTALGDPGDQPCYAFFHGRSTACVPCQTMAALHTNAIQDWEWRHPDGRTFMIHDRPFTDVDGEVLVLEMLFDITGHKQTEHALRESLLFQNETETIARVGGWKANPQTDFLVWTEGVYHIVEAPPDYQPGLQNALRFYDPAYIPQIQQALARAFEDGTPFSLETKIITTTGRQLWAELHGLARIEEGAQTYIVGTLQDITERKQAEAKLNEQIAELRRWHELTLGREMRILGLKQEVNELLAQAGQPPRYASAHEQNGHP